MERKIKKIILDSVLVRIKTGAQEQQRESGILIPEASIIDSYEEAEVISVGEGLYNAVTNTFTPLGIEIGDVVLVKRNSGKSMMLNSEELKMVKYSDIICVFE